MTPAGRVEPGRSFCFRATGFGSPSCLTTSLLLRAPASADFTYGVMLNNTQITIGGPLIGRRAIIETLLKHLRDETCVLLVGEAGVGKTAVLQEVMAAAKASPRDRRPIYCRSVKTVKDCLEWVAAALHAEHGDSVVAAAEGPRHKWLPANKGEAFWRKTSMRVLCRIVFPKLRTGRYTLVVDHLSPLRSNGHAFFERLVMELKVPVIAAVRGVQPADIGKLWWISQAFVEIQVPPLNPDQTRNLIEQMLLHYRVDLPDRTEFVRTLARVSRGNPGVITRVCRRAAGPQYRFGGRTSLRLLMLDLNLGDLQGQLARDV